MDSYSTLLNLNIMASLRTGHLVIDVLIAMLLPLVAGAVTQLVYEWWPSLLQRTLTRLRRGESCTVIAHNIISPGRLSATLNENDVLQECLYQYVGSHTTPTQYTCGSYRYQRLPTRTLTYPNLADTLRNTYTLMTVPRAGAPVRVVGDVSLEIVAEGGKSGGNNSNNNGNGNDNGGGDGPKSPVSYDDDDEDDSGDEQSNAQGRYKTPQGIVYAHRNDDGGRRATRRQRRHVMVLRSRDTTGVACSDATYELASKALEWYKGAVRATVDHNRYLYQPLLPAAVSPLSLSAAVAAAASLTLGSTEHDTAAAAVPLTMMDGDEAVPSAGPLTCRRYVLSSEKTFNTLFFPQKARLMALMNAFMTRSGRYAIAGVPHRMVLLLHGPPGTGKTSLIKAMAVHMQRHILSIDLARVRTNRQLRDLMHDTRVRVTTQHVGEDGGAPAAGAGGDGGAACSYGNEKAKMLRCDQVIYVLEDIDTTSALRAPTHGASSQHHHSHHSHHPHNDHEGDDGAMANGGRNAVVGMAVERVCVAGQVAGASSRMWRAMTQERLSVAGVLEALGGILDAPRRIVVMTSNHIEHLHPALLRPGVVTMRLYMGMFSEACALEMVRHYFAGDPALADEATMAAICAAVARARDSRGVSPAEVEQMCAESDTVLELLQLLQQGSRTEIY